MPSALIHVFSYDLAERRLEIQFTSGRAYYYQDVPPEVYEAFTRAFAKGVFFNRQIRGRYHFVERSGGDDA